MCECVCGDLVCVCLCVHYLPDDSFLKFEITIFMSDTIFLLRADVLIHIPKTWCVRGACDEVCWGEGISKRCLLIISSLPHSLPHDKAVLGGQNPQDALSCRSFFAKKPLIIGLFCKKCPLKIRHPMGLRQHVKTWRVWWVSRRVSCVFYVCPILWQGSEDYYVWESHCTPNL